MNIYLDACCVNRPFDDQSQSRVHLEAEAILLIFGKVRKREWDWTSSEILLYEIAQNPDDENQQRVLSLTSMANRVVEITDKILARAEELEDAGFDSYDALHLASAEQAQVDVFLTTDDAIVKTANRSKKLLDFRIENPVKWLEEVLK